MSIGPDALVVRGGTVREVEVIAKKVERNVAHGEIPALSVWAHDQASGEGRIDTIRRIVKEAGVPHTKVQVASHQDLIDAGFSLALDTSDGQAQCHYNVALSYPLDNAELQAFVDCFGLPEEKPVEVLS